jgi:hypothetical protein
MSIQAMTWAFKQRHIADPMQRYVLLCLANYAGEEGCNAFPSVARLGRDSGLSERTIQRALHALEEGGVIKRGNQEVAAAYIKDEGKRPTVYDLIFRTGVTQSPVVSDGCQTVKAPVTDSHRTGVTQSPNPSEIRHITKESVTRILENREKPPEGREPTFELEFKKRFGVLPS